LAALAAGCEDQSGAMRDGYYTAEVEDYDADGWKEFLTIYVNDGSIATAEFNAVNKSGMLRTWDQDYVRQIHLRYHVNPNLFPRLYANYLVSVQDPARIQPLARGRRTHGIFIKLAQAAIEGSRTGRQGVMTIPRPKTDHPEDI
jgi:major membrane immunogen (membrane-anchored lipoprotein)